MRLGLKEITSLRHARQAHADVTADLAELRAELNELFNIPQAQRTTEQSTRLQEIDQRVAPLARHAADVAQVLAQFERRSDEERGQGSMCDATRPSGRLFSQMFPNVSPTMNGWQSSGEFLRVVGHGLHDSRLMAASMSGSDGSSGGFAVPPSVLGPWLDQALESEIVRSRATVWPMTTDERTVPAWDTNDRSGDDIAGFEIQWTPELGTMDLQVGKIRRIKLKARKGAILAEASEELRADGLDFDTQLNAIIVKALSYGLDRNFLFGAGGNQPLGALASAARVTVAKETGQAASTVYYANLANMLSRLSPGSFMNSLWLCHTSTLPMLLQLSIPIGTGGSHVPVLTESGGQYRILTRPAIITEKMRPIGNEGDIALVDLSQYSIGLRSDMVIDRSQHVGFTRDAITYRLKIRIDGQPNLSAPIQPPNSAPTVSPFVTLATRS